MPATRSFRFHRRARLFASCWAVIASVAGTAVATTEHRDPPPVTNVGTKSKPLRLVALIPSDYPQALALGDFARFVPASQWLADLQKAFPLAASAPANRPTNVLFVADMPDLRHQSRTVGAYQDYVYGKARGAGLHADGSRQTIYLLYIPCADPHGMDSFGCTPHHPVLDPTRHTTGGHAESDLFTAGDSLAVVTSPPGDTLDQRTATSSHETAEAYTNTRGVGQWRLHSAHPDDPWQDAPPWVRDSGTIEMADLAAGSAWFEADPLTRRTFAFERIYSPFRVEHGSNDFFVPSQTHPQYNVTTAPGGLLNDWHAFGAGSAISIPVTAWAEPGVTSFTVTASVSTSGGDSTNACVLTRKSWTVHDGSTFRLQLQTIAPTDHVWCTIKLKSVRSSPPAHDDASHYWMVGVFVLGPI